MKSTVPTSSASPTNSRNRWCSSATTHRCGSSVCERSPSSTRRASITSRTSAAYRNRKIPASSFRASIPKYTKSCTKRDSTPCWARKTSARISMRRSDGPKNWLSHRKRNSFPAKRIYPGSAKRVQNKNTVSTDIGTGQVKMRGPDKSGPRIFFTSENNNKQRLFFQSHRQKPLLARIIFDKHLVIAFIINPFHLQNGYFGPAALFFDPVVRHQHSRRFIIRISPVIILFGREIVITKSPVFPKYSDHLILVLHSRKTIDHFSIPIILVLLKHPFSDDRSGLVVRFVFFIGTGCGQTSQNPQAGKKQFFHCQSLFNLVIYFSTSNSTNPLSYRAQSKINTSLIFFLPVYRALYLVNILKIHEQFLQ